VQRVLELEPNHAKALRTLRELYATAGDFTGLEKLYARLGQEEELVDALLGIADRLDAKAQRLPLVERAAQLAQQRAESAKDAAQVTALERARQVWSACSPSSRRTSERRARCRRSTQSRRSGRG